MAVNSAVRARGYRCAGLEARITAFIFDTIVLLAFAAVFVIVALLQLLLRSDFGDVDPPDSAYCTAWLIIVAVIPFWLVFNLWLQLWRGQSVGKYIIGIRVVRTDGRALGAFGAFWRLLLLNPLLFHPILMLPWALLAVFSFSLTVNAIVLILAGTLMVLSLVATPIALVAVLSDGQRRALHDRIVGTLVVQGG